MPQISVIVPIYNVEKFLPDCIDSILSQTFSDFELILVNDGSPDNCGVICDEYVKMDSRIQVIHQENQGLSGARNTGMDVAQGEYIAFIDSDDVVTCDYLENLLCVIKETDSDIAVCQMHEFEENLDISDCISEKHNIKGYKIYTNIEACIGIYEGWEDLSVSSCNKLFSKMIIKELRFPIGRLHEDNVFTPIACYKSKKIVTIKNDMYYYRERSGSIMRKKFNIKRYDALWAMDFCIDFFENNKEIEIVKLVKKERERLIGIYTIYAKRDNVVVPTEYRMGLWQAICYLRRTMSPRKFEYYLAVLNPKFVIINEYIVKLEKILRIRR